MDPSRPHSQLPQLVGSSHLARSGDSFFSAIDSILFEFVICLLHCRRANPGAHLKGSNPNAGANSNQLRRSYSRLRTTVLGAAVFAVLIRLLTMSPCSFRKRCLRQNLCKSVGCVEHKEWKINGDLTGDNLIPF